MSNNSTPKPKNVDCFRVPHPMWRKFKKGPPKAPKKRKPGRPRTDNRAVLNGFGMSCGPGASGKRCTKTGLGCVVARCMNAFKPGSSRGCSTSFCRSWCCSTRRNGRSSGSGNRWTARIACPPGGSQTGKNPTDRGQRGSTIHLLIDQRGAPLAMYITGANGHDKRSADDLIISIVVPRPDPTKVEQHLCMDRGHDYEDVHQLVEQERYVAHIKHRRRRGEPLIEQCPIPGETQFPARRWVVERTFGWLAKRCSLRSR